MSEIKRFEYNWAGRPLVVEIGEMAKQANGACLVKYGDSVVLSAVCSKDAKANQDFFPLMVIYQEKLYAAGKIPGGFLRREGRPSEHETLTSRLIDRPIRPMFDEGYLDEVQIVNTVLSSDQDATAEMAAMIGSSIALMISDIPFLGPIAGVNVGYVDGNYIINPTKEQEAKSSIQLTVAGSVDAINMVEAGANEVSEDEMFGALKFGHEEIQRLCNFQNEIAKACAKKKVVPSLFELNKEIEKETKDFAFDKLIKAIRIEEKTARYKAIDDVFAETMEHFGQRNFIKQVEDFKVLDNDAKANFLKHVKLTLDNVLHEEVRRLITVDKVRPDGRKQDEIRPLSSRVDVLPRTHGSALFTRGQTQSLSVTTLGALNETQIIDGLNEVEQSKRFMLHYNFPQYSVGETGRYGSPGRREIGHGALGERAILAVIPSEEEFPYTIRLVSEIIESNGSTSQASICAGVLSLMAAGVPLKAPVAGIAMGLIMEGKDYTILSDIQGMEDHLGDMDFKVAGTAKGITALQMDMKIRGITYDILKESLAQAKLGRLHILDHMVSTINTPREEVSTTAPKVKMMRIKPTQIKDVIGSGGKVINQIIEDSGNVKIDIEQDGKVYLMHQNLANVLKAKQIIEDLLRAPEVGQMYPAKVVRVEKFGCFVELWPGCEGLVHVSKLDDKRVEKVEDVVSLGDTIIVKCININEKGQIDLSRKDAISEASQVDKKD